MKDLREELVRLLNEDKKVHKLEEMARVGSLNGFEFKVYGGERNIPHIHMDSADKKVCIRLDIAEYYAHGKSKDTLNSNERDILIDFMNNRHRRFDITNYEYMLNLWNENNPNYEIDEEMQMPDYKNLECK